MNIHPTFFKLRPPDYHCWMFSKSYDVGAPSSPQGNAELPEFNANVDLSPTEYQNQHIKILRLDGEATVQAHSSPAKVGCRASTLVSDPHRSPLHKWPCNQALLSQEPEREGPKYSARAPSL